MKRLVSWFCVLIMLIMTGTCANAEPDILNTITSTLSFEELNRGCNSMSIANAIVESVANSGTTVPDAFRSIDASIQLYDFVLDLCELSYGDYYHWSIDKQNQFDQLMVELGQLPYCFHLLPNANELTLEEALALAYSAISQRYGVGGSLCAADVYASYYLVNPASSQGMWRFGIEYSDGFIYTVHVYDGIVSQCDQRRKSGNLEAEYNLLCEERGAFFKWSLQEKMDFAQQLPAKLSIAEKEKDSLMSYDELAAISQYGFCLPHEDAITQEQAYSIAANAVAQAYDLPENWDENAEVYYSFFFSKNKQYIWRVIFWKTGHPNYASGIVDMDAETGEICRIEKNGTKPNDYIPLIDRL